VRTAEAKTVEAEVEAARATRATRAKRPRNTAGLLEAVGKVWIDKWASSADDAHYLYTSLKFLATSFRL